MARLLDRSREDHFRRSADRVVVVFVDGARHHVERGTIRFHKAWVHWRPAGRGDEPLEVSARFDAITGFIATEESAMRGHNDGVDPETSGL